MDVAAESGVAKAEAIGGGGADDERVWGLEPLVISAPFGNYVQPPGATPTVGTFTRSRRPGRLWRVLRTVRYYRRLGAWVNRIGLRNPGIDWFVERCRSGRVDPSRLLVSVHGFSTDDWWELLEKSASVEPLGVELNISCPNVGEVTWPAALFERAVATGRMVVVKLPPVRFERVVEASLAAGARTFHCCNTLPVPKGGMSGKPLRPLVVQCMARVRAMAGDERVRIIAGGGVTVVTDVDEYAVAGADHVAVGSMLMHPRFGGYVLRKGMSHPVLSPLVDRAAERLGAGDVRRGGVGNGSLAGAEA